MNGITTRHYQTTREYLYRLDFSGIHGFEEYLKKLLTIKES
jgi:hypothetical protein